MAAKCCDSPVIISEYGSSVSCCTNCGEVIESVFLSNEAPYSEAPQYSRPGVPLKSIRNEGWALAGQEAEARNYRLKSEVHNYIKQFTVEIACPGLCERVCTLFDQAMTSGQFRWGFKAVLVAGAALVLALRETDRFEPMRDIIYLLQKVQGVPIDSLSTANLGRVLSAVKTLLHIEHKSVDPVMLMDGVQNTLLAALDGHVTRAAPASAADFLARPRVQRAADTARCVVNQLARLPWTHELRTLPFPPTACAIALISLEADARATMPRSAEFAGWLGGHHSVGQATVMSRARLLQDLALGWIEQVDWLERYKPAAKKATGKRLVVARGLKDALAHQEKLWKERVDANTALRLNLGEAELEGMPGACVCPGKRQRDDECIGLPVKRRALPASVRSAAQFLLDPTAAPITRRRRRVRADGDAPRPRTTVCLPTAAHLLSTDAALGHAPTRLQLLATSRGGESGVNDDELFDDDEFEGLLRPAEEVDKLSVLRDVWAAEEEARAERVAERRLRRRRKREDGEPEESTRLDKDAVARFFEEDEDKKNAGDGDKDDSWLDDLKAFSPELDPDLGLAVGLGVGMGLGAELGQGMAEGGEDKDDYELARRELVRMHAGATAGADELVVGDWRAASPSGWGGCYD